MTESGRLCAFITKVRKGSLADTVGHLRPGIQSNPNIDILLKKNFWNKHPSFIKCNGFTGDQVLEWNGRLLQGATFKEVYNIILESKPEPQVELVVSRPIG